MKRSHHETSRAEAPGFHYEKDRPQQAIPGLIEPGVIGVGGNLFLLAFLLAEAVKQVREEEEGARQTSSERTARARVFYGNDDDAKQIDEDEAERGNVSLRMLPSKAFELYVEWGDFPNRRRRAVKFGLSEAAQIQIEACDFGPHDRPPPTNVRSVTSVDDARRYAADRIRVAVTALRPFAAATSAMADDPEDE